MQFILIIGFAALALVVLLLAWKKKKACAPLSAKSRKKEENKKKILAELGKKGKITNEEIRKLVGVSRRTAIDYMDELEKSGDVRQVGKTGHQAHYVLQK